MRTALVGTVTAVLVAVVGGIADGRQPERIDAKLLVGKWVFENELDRAERLIEYYEFTKDGKVVLGFDDFGKGKKTAEGNYKLDGNKLSMTLKISGKERREALTVNSLTASRLVMTGVARKDVLTRVEGKSRKND
ncbi:MAG: lipocalin family protein [Gemmataceae bacterium]